MSLYHQRVPLSRLVVTWLVQPSPPLSSVFVLPCVNTGLAEVERFKLRIGIPQDSRSMFVFSHHQGRIIESLLDGDFEIIALGSWWLCGTFGEKNQVAGLLDLGLFASS